jgi:hypothetical protein
VTADFLDHSLLALVKSQPGSPTYYLANSTGMGGKTAVVRRRLKVLEAAGKVRSGFGRYYSHMLCWWVT